MPKQPKRSTEIDLRRILPNIALRMDTQFLMNEARLLGIKARVSRSSKTATIRLPLTMQHSISISPVDKGAQGVSEWFTFTPPCECPQVHPEMTSRVFIQIADEMVEPKANECFTVEAPNFEMMLRISLTIYYSLTGKKLAPIIAIVTPTGNAA